MVFNFNNTYIKLNKNFYSEVTPKKIKNPKILILNKKLMKKLDIENNNDLAEILCGNKLLSKPIAQAYAGHQFGNFTMLGDGRALLLGEHITKKGIRYDIQLKGSGITPYSRGGDGKATISSMLREYLYSCAMNNLKIKSSQSLAIILTNEKVLREKIENGSILVRIMESHIRIGTFEYVSYSSSKEELVKFTDYVIERHYKNILNYEEKYLKFFEEVMDNLIDMVIEWTRVGFIHGVMNTDNMNINGETFDFGPCAFMNYYDPNTKFSSIDAYGRYSFKNQKNILLWNLTRFAETLIPIIDSDNKNSIEKLNKILKKFNEKYNEKYYKMMKLKLGIKKEGNFNSIIDKFTTWLEKNKTDYTNTFIELINPTLFADKSYSSKEFIELKKELSEIGLDKDIMKKVNPLYIPRNYQIEEAISEYNSKNSLEKFNKLLKIIENPYLKKPNSKIYQTPPLIEYDLKYKTFCNT